ncbi:HAMP domain-containing sensor histidine kinase [Thermosulfurimonas sp. F29]|uniref:sensor histidine kinase n=1 Tax=Thermosulfurimonas sp. F29 TaxID=2867247 RepID=UPI001C82C008|nr:HAMP domain-containing sensor histidine kinase [Thermosulfurimonas sp. F29]MBX6424265.1 HAMP domain-containing histidine kinase [Thermosulfurimonas sp. F29]
MLLILALILFIIVIISFAMAHYLVSNFLELYYTKRLLFLAKQTSRNLSLFIIINNKETANKIIEEVLKNREIIGATVTKTNGEIWIKRGITDTKFYIKMPVQITSTEEELFLSPSKIGELKLYYTKEPLRLAIKKIFIISASIISAIAMLASILIYILLYRAIAIPLEALLKAANEISRGKIDLRISGHGLKETEELAKAFNEMLQAIQKYQNDLQKAYRQMAEQKFLAELGKFAAIAAHEIKNPLGIMQGALDLLKKDLPHEERKRLASFLEEEIKRIDVLVKNLLIYAKPIKPHLQSIKISTILHTVHKLQMLSISRKIHINIKKDLNIKTDPDLLVQVFYNLIRNAFEAEARNVLLTVHSKGDYVSILVCDDGRGIPDEYTIMIFEPFFTTKSKGAGLGLTVVKRIIENLNGSIEVRKCPHLGGAEFEIRLPAA